MIGMDWMHSYDIRLEQGLNRILTDAKELSDQLGSNTEFENETRLRWKKEAS